MYLQNHCLLKSVQINTFLKLADTRVLQTSSGLFGISSSSGELTSAHACTVHNVPGFSELLVGSQHREKPERSPSTMSK